MARRLRFGPFVPDDLQRAVEYYDHHSPASGNRFRYAANRGLDQIERIADAMPFVWPGQPYRFHRIRRFPYLIFFRIDETTAYLLGVFHTASDPMSWVERDRPTT